MEGKNLFVKTVTLYYTGEVVSLDENEIVLVKAAWIPSTGRWYNCVLKGVEEIREVEPYPAELEVHLQRKAVVEYFEWKHDLPRVQKG